MAEIATPPNRHLPVLFSLGHCANDWAPVAMWLIVPAFGASIGATPTEIGLLFTLHAVGSALAFLPAGFLTDHVTDRGRLLLFTFVWVSLGYAAASFATSYWVFAALIALAGMGDAAWHPIATGVLANQHRGKVAHALGVHAIGGQLAEVVAPLVAGFVIGWIDWRAAIWVSILPTVGMGIVFIYVARLVPRVPAKRATLADFMALFALWSGTRGTTIMGLLVTYNIALYALLSMTPLLLQRGYGFSAGAAGLVFSAMLLFGALAQPLGGRFADQFGRYPVIHVGTLLAAGAAILAWAAGDVIWTLLAAGLAISLLLAIRPAFLALAVDHAGDKAGASLGLTFVVMDGVGSIGAVLAGLAGERDLTNAYLLGGVAIAVTWLLALKIRTWSARAA